MISALIFWVPNGVPQLLAVAILGSWYAYFFITPTVYLILPYIWFEVTVVLFSVMKRIEVFVKRTIQRRNRRSVLKILTEMRS